GREVLVLGTGRNARGALAYDPAANRWRRLSPLPSARFDPTSVWTEKRVLLWGSRATLTAVTPDGLAYDPTADRWSSLPMAPLKGSGQTVAWTGRELIAWG